MPDAKKEFDAVEMMRSIRARLSEQIAGMTLEEEIRWLRAQELGDPMLEELREKAARPNPSV